MFLGYGFSYYTSCNRSSIEGAAVEGMDALLSIVQILKINSCSPVGINMDNTGMLAVQMLSLKYPELEKINSI